MPISGRATSYLGVQAGDNCVRNALWYDGERGGEPGDAVPGQLVQVVAASQEPQEGELLEPERLGPHSATPGLDQPPGSLLRTVMMILKVMLFVVQGVSSDQACKLRFRLRELISCFCCVQTSPVALKADSRGSRGT